MITFAAIFYFGGIGIAGAMLLYAVWLGTVKSVKAGFVMAGLGFGVYLVGMFIASVLGRFSG